MSQRRLYGYIIEKDGYEREYTYKKDGKTIHVWENHRYSKRKRRAFKIARQMGGAFVTERAFNRSGKPKQRTWEVS